jgi:hypothetical protein
MTGATSGAGTANPSGAPEFTPILRFKCEKLTDGRRTLTHEKSSFGLWPGELKKRYRRIVCRSEIQDGHHDST